MKKNNFGWFIVVVLIVLWSLYQIYPPTSRDLIQQFAARAENQDATFTNILTRATELQKAGTNSEFANLQEAIGTNSIQKYFLIDAKNELYPNTFILNQLQREASGKIKLGLDLQGGTSFLVEMDTNALAAASGDTNHVASATETSGAILQAIEVLRKRIDKFGVAEPVIQSAGGNRILIQLPGLSQSAKESAQKQIQQAAFLEFRMVKDDSNQYIDESTGKILQPIPPGYEVLRHVLPPKDGKQQPSEIYVVKKKAEPGLSGDIVANAGVSRDGMGNLQINFELTPAAGKRFGEVTREYAPDPQTGFEHRLAIVLDGELVTAPAIKGAIEGGEGQITGSYSDEEARSIANVLKNPLRAPLKIDSSSDVSATLGQDSIRSGIRASIAAVILVSAFMLCYYWIAGLTANVALVTNIIILLGVMCSVGTTLTLPGIAGVVLTIGMAVDANVLIYERLREEIAKGKSLRGAIDAGYARAFGTIFDSHVTTLISSIILIIMGTGEIKGFGVTLTIGVAASLFTALVVTRLIFNFLLNRNWLKSLPMLHIIKSAKVNFMAIAKPVFILSWVFAIAAVAYGGFFRGEKLFGVDFRGGDSTTFSFSQKIGVDQIRSALNDLGEKDSQIQYQKDVSSSLETLNVTTSSGSAQKVNAALEQKFPQAQFKTVRSFNVGGSVGEDVRNSAIVACLLSLFGILVYVAFRYEFSFAVGAIVAVIHDVLLAIGCYCIANAVSGRQFNATVVAAVLTIIGFSINDKIVIFDRIREDLKLGMRGTFKEIINQALNQTLSRTIITSGTVFLATLSLFIFGGGVINDFAFTFLVGIITGTYSSIYIASVFVLWWHKGNRPNIGASQVTMQNAPATRV
ncbi:MAG TPA: protein translocase subunit SecD [Verrucomicrobiae bacterium]|nr:protein translocase subunit SecD [Verrucomicrobiae bacterium]